MSNVSVHSSLAPRLCSGVLVAFAAFGCQVGTAPTGDAGAGDGGGTIVVRCEGTADADGDGLYDEIEGTTDWDGDGTPNYQDTDSDDDGYTDAEEHGTDMGCAARDIDGDGIPDYLDLDADGDGLSDEEERTRYFTDSRNPDSDGDGFPDLAEVATGHDPSDAADRIPDETFFVVLPYNGESQERELLFGTMVHKADVFFLMDRTGSMDSAAASLESRLSSIVPEMRASLTDVGVGFGAYAGFGGDAAGTECMFGTCFGNDGPDGDMPFELVQTITTDEPTMQAAVGRLGDISYGGANWASSNEAMYLAATGEGFAPWLGPQNCTAVPDEVGRRYGYPCFRPGALPIMVVLTDAASKNGPGASVTYDPADFTMGPAPHTQAQTLAALQSIGARVIGLILNETSQGDPVSQFTTWASSTGTVDASGTPMLFRVNNDGSGLDTRVIEAIRILAEETPQNISAAARDGEDRPEEIGPVDALNFIKELTPVSIFDGTNNHTCPDATRCDDRLFFDVTPGATVRFRVRFRNDFQEPRSFAQVFLATIVVLGNGVAELDSRQVVIVVPSGSVPILI